MSASALTRAARAYVRHAPGIVGKPWLVSNFLDEHLRTQPVHTDIRLRSGDVVPVITSDVIQRYQYLFGEWEPNLSALLRERLKPGDTFIDVGAHRGRVQPLGVPRRRPSRPRCRDRAVPRRSSTP